MRSNAGLYYENYREFAEALYLIETDRALADALGRHGREFFARDYAWPVVEGKYLDVLRRLHDEDAAPGPATPAPAREGGRRSGIEARPGWFARRRRTLPAARGVMEALPHGA